jgi:serine/threonine-protein kinase
MIEATFLAAGIVAWLNHRSRKADLRGATKMFLWCWLPYCGAYFLRVHHVASPAEINTFWRVVMVGGINAIQVWIIYLALEPWVRRRWPQSMISWSSYTVKGWRDPLVGRDLLYSVSVGVLFALLDLLQSAIRAPASAPVFPPAGLFALMGVTSITSSILVGFGGEVVNSLFIFFTLFISRVVVRKEWLAVIGMIAIVSAVDFAPVGFLMPDILFEFALLGILAIVILRFGLIAAIFGYAIKAILRLPHTLDLSAWYAGTTMVPLVLLALLAIYGFHTSLGGRRLIQMPE